MWALDRGISWTDPLILQRILASGLKPESLQPSEFFGMIADPSLGLCDPKLVGKVFDISTQNLTRDELQVSRIVFSLYLLHFFSQTCQLFYCVWSKHKAPVAFLCQDETSLF
jgi:hypothetical protein